MKRLVFMLSILVLLTGCGSGPAESSDGSIQAATSLSYQLSDSYLEFCDVLDNATFYVKAIAETMQEIGGSMYEFQFTTLEDYGGNLKATDTGEFCIYTADPDEYIIGETYFLTLNARTTPKYSSIGIILYSAVDTSRILTVCEDEVMIVDATSSDETIENEQNTVRLGSVAAVENMIQEYVSAHIESIEERTAEELPNISAGTVENAVEQADAIWEITIQDGYEVNSYFSVCSYKVDQVLKGDTEYENQVFNETIPTAVYEVDGVYLLVLCEVERESYTELAVAFDDYWLLPIDSADSATILDIYSW